MSIPLVTTIIDYAIGYLLAGFAVCLCAREFLSVKITIPRAFAVIFLWPLVIDRAGWIADGRDVPRIMKQRIVRRIVNDTGGSFDAALKPVEWSWTVTIEW